MDYEDVKKSKFNAGIAQTERIDALQRAINAAKFNPLARNIETGTFNYEVMMTCVNNLISEGWDKFSDTEQKLILRYDRVLKGMAEHLAPIKINHRNGSSNIDKENYKRFLTFFEKFERKIKELYGNHNLNSPSSEDDEGL